MPWATVENNVYLPLRPDRGRAGNDARPRIAEMLALVGIGGIRGGPIRVRCRSGMRMRVAIARARWSHRTQALLLMDEPFAALDEITRARNSTTICCGYGAMRGFTAVFVTHSVFESVYLSTDIAIMTPAALRRIFARCMIDRSGSAGHVDARRVPHQPRLCRILRRRYRGTWNPPCGNGGMNKPDAVSCPAATGRAEAAVLALWEILVRALDVPRFVLPPPSLIVAALVENFPQLLLDALWETAEADIAGVRREFRRRPRTGDPLRAEPPDRAQPAALRHRAAGDAHRGDRCRSSSFGSGSIHMSSTARSSSWR